jgi:DNA-binding Lrp family transcriptional regulator
MEKMLHNFPAYLPADVLQDHDLTYGEKVVYWAIAARANGKKEMWATNRRIGEDIGMSKNRVSASIKKLISKGYLKSEDKDGLRHLFTITVGGMGVTADGNGVTVGGMGVLPQAVRGVTVGGNQKDTKEEYKEKNNTLKREFDLFYSAYPRKKKPRDAEKAWKAEHTSIPQIDDLLDILEKHKKSWEDREQRYIPYPASWLRAHSWEEDIEIEENRQERLMREIMEKDGKDGF